MFFFFQAEDGIRDKLVTGVQTCALPISRPLAQPTATPRPQPTATPRPTSTPQPPATPQPQPTSTPHLLPTLPVPTCHHCRPCRLCLETAPNSERYSTERPVA